MKNYVINDLFDYQNRYIFQPTNGFKFSLDSILLAEYVCAHNDTKILDLCTGCCAIPLIISTRTSSHIDAIEIQEEIYELAQKSILYNNLEDNITLHLGDINNAPEILGNKKYDIITCNPPYFEVGCSIINDYDVKSIARHEVKLVLEDVLRIGSIMLKDNGILYMVHIPSRLDEILILASKYRINVKEVVIITTKSDKEPSIILIKCIKNAKKGIKVKLKNVENLTSYQQLFKEEV